MPSSVLSNRLAVPLGCRLRERGGHQCRRRPPAAMSGSAPVAVWIARRGRRRRRWCLGVCRRLCRTEEMSMNTGCFELQLLQLPCLYNLSLCAGAHARLVGVCGIRELRELQIGAARLGLCFQAFFSFRPRIRSVRRPGVRPPSSSAHRSSSSAASRRVRAPPGCRAAVRRPVRRSGRIRQLAGPR